MSCDALPGSAVRACLEASLKLSCGVCACTGLGEQGPGGCEPGAAETCHARDMMSQGFAIQILRLPEFQGHSYC